MAMPSILWDMRPNFFPLRAWGMASERGASRMAYWTSYRSYLAGAMTAAALFANVPAAQAQPTPQQGRLASGIDEAVKALDIVPRFKKLSPEAKRHLVEFVLGNTLFVLAHEMGHGLI